jgi:hypothetical protein
VFKVPHHGSVSADNPNVWEIMLESNPYALLTPFARGRSLPTQGDIARLKTKTPNLYCTAKIGGWAPPKRDSAVEKTLKEVVRARKAIIGPMGHVRIRVMQHSFASIRAEVFNGAYQV